VKELDKETRGKAFYPLKALSSIDWDFTKAKTNYCTHSIHPYPAKFIPQIPRCFITHFSKIEDTIYDPFVGSGTTAVEANILGRNAIGNDINELAILISRVKTTPITNIKLKKLDVLLNTSYNNINKFYTKKKTIIKPEIINLSLWFKEFVIAEIVIIKEEIEKLEEIELRNLGFVALSGIIVTVSNQDSDTRYVRVSKKLTHFDTFHKFSKQLTKLRKNLNDSYEEISKGSSILKLADTREEGIFPENSADLAITSPPYPNAYDYHLYHKYRLFWLDMDPYLLRRNEIGAHADYSKKNGSTEIDFLKDMNESFINISKILKPNSFFIIVIGDSILKGRKVKNDEIIKKAAKETMFEYVGEFKRNLELAKKSFNPQIGNIKTEKILVFKNTK
jgi:site-specific DNA-methyltransferase (cytosine-N4-specific)